METLTADKKRYGTIEDWNTKNPTSWDKRYVFVLNHQNEKPSIERQHFPNSVSLKLQDRILDKGKGKMRIIKVVEGEMSIYQDEQTLEGQKREPIRAMFSQRGDIVIEQRENFKLDFFMKSNFNGSNSERDQNVKPMFYMLELGKGIKHQMNQDKVEAEARTWCLSDDTKFKSIVRYGRVLGVDVDRDPDEVRWALLQIAKKDPQKFMDGLNNKYTIRKFYVLDAIDKGIFRIDSQSNTLLWKTGALIVSAPMGNHPVDYFVDMSISTTQMDMVFQTMKGLVEPEQQANTSSEAKKTGGDDGKAKSKTATELLIDKATELGIITKKGPWHYFADHKWMGNEKTIEALETDAVIKQSIEKLVAEKAAQKAE